VKPDEAREVGERYWSRLVVEVKVEVEEKRHESWTQNPREKGKGMVLENLRESLAERLHEIRHQPAFSQHCGDFLALVCNCEQIVGVE